MKMSKYDISANNFCCFHNAVIMFFLTSEPPDSVVDIYIYFMTIPKFNIAMFLEAENVLLKFNECIFLPTAVVAIF